MSRKKNVFCKTRIIIIITIITAITTIIITITIIFILKLQIVEMYCHNYTYYMYNSMYRNIKQENLIYKQKPFTIVTTTAAHREDTLRLFLSTNKVRRTLQL